MVPADYFGIVSGNKVPDKFARSKLHETKSQHVNAPIIDEFPVTTECELAEIISTENMYAVVGKIVNVCADEELIGADGKIDISATDLLVFDQFTWNYNVIGDVVGKAAKEGKALK